MPRSRVWAQLLLLLTCLQQLHHQVLALSVGRPTGFSSIGADNLPDGLDQSGKLRAFLVCRKECIAKCDRLVYVYSEKKEFCHECLKQCISAVVQQARSLGVDLNAADGEPERQPQMQADSAGAAMAGSGHGSRRDRRGRKRLSRKQREERRRRRRRQRQRNRKRRRGADRSTGSGGSDARGGQTGGLLKNCIVH
ncbi:hypothetical protein BOX15_Mlig001697g4 [Macrostomum lignano]|uniref:Uncharacterized protein n=1 Tax=Macrostomum lignano TaxID=282301 RepID=A0A267FR91_9PLAT|nr:hypothetical protein BOX15_Mlig001697g4 [Macrostomum lignano]